MNHIKPVMNHKKIDFNAATQDRKSIKKKCYQSAINRQNKLSNHIKIQTKKRHAQ